MARDELKDVACRGFYTDLVVRSFCHTPAYPKDGFIRTGLNRMLLPDTCGTGADSHTRFPIGISFPAGSGAVAFGAATGVMPLDMTESMLVRFKGKTQPGVTLHDLVHSIPYQAIKEGDLTLFKEGKRNILHARLMSS